MFATDESYEYAQYINECNVYKTVPRNGRRQVIYTLISAMFATTDFECRVKCPPIFMTIKCVIFPTFPCNESIII